MEENVSNEDINVPADNKIQIEKNNNDDESKPEEAARPDDQGPFSTCTRHSLSKATVDGYEDGIFTPRKSLDFKQDEATDKLIQLHPPADKKVGNGLQNSIIKQYH